MGRAVEVSAIGEREIGTEGVMGGIGSEAYVLLKDKDAQTAAVALNKQRIGSRYVEVSRGAHGQKEEGR